MYINFENNLFLPEGDDYSKAEFDKNAEEIALEGNERLQKLRTQQYHEQELKPKHKQKNGNETKEDTNKKLSFKEIFHDVAASK